MSDQRPGILLLGSYNGQDSLGDECLLECVMDQYRRASGADLRFVLHAHRHTAFLEGFGDRLTANPGLQSGFWLYRTRWRHSRLPESAFAKVAAATYGAYAPTAAALLPSSMERRALEQIRAASLLHIFGGTNFSEQWFWLNAPTYALTAALMRLQGKPTYLGPQQYGPMNVAQRRFLRAMVSTLVTDLRARNERCLELLGERDRERLTWDEVYSNRGLYPIRSIQQGTPEYILLNIRGGLMSDDSAFDQRQLRGLANTLRRVFDELRMPYLFFGVSDDSFCDDAHGLEILEQHLGADCPVRDAGRVADGRKLVDLASHAAACISMSFHGCVLSGFAAIPSIPITGGWYYDYKYSDFDRYGDGRPVPRIRLDADASETMATEVLEYIRGFDPHAAAERRRAAAALLERYYAAIVQTAIPGPERAHAG